MTKSTSIISEKRDFSIKPNQLRTSGKFPATIYGHGFESISVQMNTKEFQHIYKGSKSALIDLICGNETYSVLIKKVQMDAIKNEILNVEFQRIKTDEKIKVVVKIELVGVAPAVSSGGILSQSMSQMEIECLPNDIPSVLKVDISKLENTNDSITVGEVTYPAGVVPVTSADNYIVKISAETAEATPAAAG